LALYHHINDRPMDAENFDPEAPRRSMPSVMPGWGRVSAFERANAKIAEEWRERLLNDKPLGSVIESKCQQIIERPSWASMELPPLIPSKRYAPGECQALYLTKELWHSPAHQGGERSLGLLLFAVIIIQVSQSSGCYENSKHPANCHSKKLYRQQNDSIKPKHMIANNIIYYAFINEP